MNVLRNEEAPADTHRRRTCTRDSPSLGRKRTAAMMPSVMKLSTERVETQQAIVACCKETCTVGRAAAEARANQAGWDKLHHQRRPTHSSQPPHPRKPSTSKSGCQANSWPSYAAGSIASAMATHSVMLSVWIGRSSTGAPADDDIAESGGKRRGRSLAGRRRWYQPGCAIP